MKYLLWGGPHRPPIYTSVARDASPPLSHTTTLPIRQLLARWGASSLSVVVILVLFASVGCTEETAFPGYYKIQNGHSEEEVFDRLGPPDKFVSLEAMRASATVAIWIDDDVTVGVCFVDGRVISRVVAKDISLSDIIREALSSASTNP